MRRSIFLSISLHLTIIFLLSACSVGTQVTPTFTLEPTQIPQVTVTPTLASTLTPTDIPMPTEEPTATQEIAFSRITPLDQVDGPPIGKITELSWSLEGERLLVSGPEGMMIVDATTLNPQWKMEKPDFHSFIYWGDEFVALYGEQLEYRLSSNGKLQGSIQLENLEGDCYFLSPDGRYLVALNVGSELTIWNLEVGEMMQSLDLQTVFEYEIERIENMTFNHVGSTLFAGTLAGGVYRIEIENGAVQRLYPAVFRPDPSVTYNVKNDCHVLGASGHFLVVICGYYTPSEDHSTIARSNYVVRWVDVNEGGDQTFYFEVRNSYGHFSLSPDGTVLYMQGVGEFALLRYDPKGIKFQSVPNCLRHSSDPFFLGPSTSNQLAVINSYETGELFLCHVFTGEKLIALEFDTP